MAKNGFHTYDIFNNENMQTRKRYFEFCHKTALKSGLQCRCIIDDTFPKIELWGNKYQFFSYYLRTLTKCQYKLGAIKRLLSIIIW